MSVPVKEFVMTYVVEDVPSMEENEECNKTEEHFNIPWKMHVQQKTGYLSIYLECLKNSAKKWSIQTEFEFKLISANGTTLSMKNERVFGNGPVNESLLWEVPEFIKWEKLEKHYIVDRKVTIEAHVEIKKMIGFRKEKLRYFDESTKNIWEVVLIVEDKKFYVLKSFLALQSSYFRALLMGNFEESKQSEVVLKDIDPDDFQNFLELIHGESSIDDQNVNGILHLADIYDSPTAFRRCEEFLLKESKLSLKEKLEMSAQYNLMKLKNKCLTEITTIEEIRSVLPTNLKDLDPSISTVLLQKCLSFC